MSLREVIEEGPVVPPAGSLDDGEIPLTFNNFEVKYQWPTERSLRKLAFERETNGLKEAFVKFGKRRLVLPQTLFRLIRKGKGV